ncbi:hypothetical protein FPSE_03130 [Fusarium pseudograminearum CS3096]|uniref:DNA/RNA-binding protein Alba-like domain-containing protein n=1 Tax=Fusarium pseudograminearum (strain CS3096) TaxID=1028729 RepID=K3VPA1_FUSPC|nr:hypothetical protein FPSE_03130 [Fusarium pseudograminearum CS3096]EKJ76719.1 hypothetical protein FPSE_03130 [Fusarium pseudograminearum CS3096]KAF0634593.1 hypothetical protein FPSE5266_03130 [Fusarium pseudograminearum]
MSNANLTQGSGKRRPDTNRSENAQPTKRTRSDDVQIQTFALGAPHESIIAELKPKYDVLPASVISSTQIKKRVTHVANHLLAQGDRPQIALLYARTADVCKLITVVEKCKQVLSEEGKQYYQYNQLFDQPEKPRRKDIVEETILEKGTMDEGGDDSGSEDFEVMHSRFEDAVLPRPSQRIIKSMRVFLSIVPIPELKLKKGVTVQSGTAKHT